MTFYPGIPFDGESLGQSKLEVRSNFATLRSTISNAVQPNHIDVNSANPGKHIFVQMPVQTSGAANLPLANEGGMITKTAVGASELFFVRDAVATYLQMTGPVFTGEGGTGNQGLSNVGGTTMLFGGIILKWGSFNTSGNKTFLAESGSAFPNACFLVIGTNNAGIFVVAGITATGFSTGNAGTFIAIGN